MEEIFERCHNSLENDLKSLEVHKLLLEDKYGGLPLVNYENGPSLLE